MSTTAPSTLANKLGDIVSLVIADPDDDSCNESRHTGQSYEDVLTILFILAWVQVVPATLAIIQYFSSFFAKKRRIICCNEKWKKAKIEADELTMDGTMPEAPAPSYR